MIKVDIKGFKDLQQNFSSAPQKFEVFLKPALVDSVRAIQKDAKANVTVDMGKLRGSIRSEVRRLTGSVVAGEKHGTFIEEGTRPHFPPVAPLEAWAMRKLGRPGLGFVVARKIAQKGTKAQPFMQPALESNVRNIERFFLRSLGRMVNYLAR